MISDDVWNKQLICDGQVRIVAENRIAKQVLDRQPKVKRTTATAGGKDLRERDLEDNIRNDRGKQKLGLVTDRCKLCTMINFMLIHQIINCCLRFTCRREMVSKEKARKYEGGERDEKEFRNTCR